MWAQLKKRGTESNLLAPTNLILIHAVLAVARVGKTLHRGEYIGLALPGVAESIAYRRAPFASAEAPKARTKKTNKSLILSG
jgi:hypothetical protein